MLSWNECHLLSVCVREMIDDTTTNDDIKIMLRELQQKIGPEGVHLASFHERCVGVSQQEHDALVVGLHHYENLGNAVDAVLDDDDDDEDEDGVLSFTEIADLQRKLAGKTHIVPDLVV